MRTLTLLLPLFWGLSPAFCATRTWDGGGLLERWASGINWTGNDPPNPGDDLVFPLNGPTGFATDNNFSSGTGFHSISFANHTLAPVTGWEHNGNLVLLGAGGMTIGGPNSGNARGTLKLPIRLAANQTWTVVRGTMRDGGTLDVNGMTLTVTNNDPDPALTDNEEADLQFVDSVLGGGTIRLVAAVIPASVVIPGFPPVVRRPLEVGLHKANSFSAALEIGSEVTVNAYTATSLGNTSGGTRIQGKLNLRSAGTVVEAFVMNNGALFARVPGITLAGNMTLSGTAIVETGDNSAVFAVHSGSITGSGSLLVQGGGTLRLTGTNPVSFEGLTRVSARSGQVMTLELDRTATTAVGEDLEVGFGGRAKWLRSSQLPGAGDLRIDAGGEANLNGQTDSVNTLKLVGGHLLTQNGILGVKGDIVAAEVDPDLPEVQGTLRLENSAAPHLVTVVDDNPGNDLTIIGDIVPGSGPGSAVMRKVLDGQMLWQGTGTIPRIEVAEGHLEYAGSSPGMDVVLDGGTFEARDRVRDISATAAGGTYESSSASLTVRNFTLNSATTFRAAGRNAGGDARVIATGTVNLGNASLTAPPAFSADAFVGVEKVLIQKNSAGPVTGTFAGLPEGSEVSFSGRVFKISYTGGDGNDVTLALESFPPSGVTRFWTGGGTTAHASEPANWNPATAPGRGDILVFPPVPNRNVIFDLGSYFPITGMRFSAQGYAVNGQALGIGMFIEADLPAGAVTVNTALRLGGGVTLSSLNLGQLQIGAVDTFSLDLNGHALTLNSAVLNQLWLTNPPLSVGTDIVALQPLLGITGRGSIAKTGTGVARVHCFCNFTGPVSVVEGTLWAGTGDALGATGAGNHTSVSSGAVLAARLGFFTDSIREDLVLSGTFLSLLPDPLPVLEVLGSINAQGNAAVEVPGSGTLTLRGQVTGGTLRKTGTGELQIGARIPLGQENSVPNTLSQLAVESGTAVLMKDAGVTAANSLYLTGGTVEIGRSNQINGSITMRGQNTVLAMSQAPLTTTLLDAGGGTIEGPGALTVNAVNSAALSFVTTVNAPVKLPAATINLIVPDGGEPVDLVFNSTVSGPGGAGFRKLGTGRVRFNGPLTVPTRVESGFVQVMGGGDAPITLPGGTLEGIGPVGSITGGGGRIEPGTSPGILNTGSLTSSPGITFAPELESATAGTGYDQINVTGTVSLAGATLETAVAPAFNAPSGTVLTIIQNDGTDAVTGTFNGLPQDAVFSAGGKTFRISYTGGTGNDVTLTVVTLGTGVTRVWDGETSTSWATATNWVNLPGSAASAPNPGDDLVFPAGAQRPSNTNNFTAGTVFNSIRIEAAGYVLSGNAVLLNAGFVFANTSGQCQINFPVTLTQPQTFSMAAGGQALVATQPVTSNGFNLTVDAGAGSGLLLAGFGGTANIVKTGTGNLSFGSSNTFTGTLTIAAGAVQLTQLAGLGSGGAGISVAPGATLGFNSTSTGTLAKPITLGGRLTFSSSPVILSGAITLPDGNNGVMESFGTTGPTVSGVLSGAGQFEKRGIGTLILSGAAANTFSGGATVTAGTLQVQKSGGVVALPGPVTIGDGSGADVLVFGAANQIGNTATVSLTGSGAALQCGTFSDTVGALRMTGGSITGTGTLSITSLTSLASAATAAININLNPGTADCPVSVEDGSAAVDLQVGGEWNGGPALKVTRSGDGTLVFAGGGTADLMQLAAGLTIFDRDWSGVGMLLNGGTLGGSGFTGDVTSDPDGGVAPGSSPGILTTKNLTGSERTVFTFEIGGTAPGTGHDQIVVAGTVAPADAELKIVWLPGFTPMAGQSFLLVDNDGTDDILTEFAGIPEGNEVVFGPVTATVSYKGGDRNDISLTIVRFNDTRTLRVWDGGGADNKWTTAANWVDDLPPQQGDSLEFPAGAAQLSNVNDYPAGSNFHHVSFTGAGYLITGAAIRLNDGVSGNFASGVSQWGLPVTFTQSQTVRMSGTGQVQFTSAATVNNAGYTLTADLDSLFAFNGVISGSGGLIKTGTGVLALQAANTFASSTAINQGAVNAGKNTALGAGAVVQAGATLVLESGDPLVIAAPLTLRGKLASIGNNHRLNGTITLPAGANAEIVVGNHRLDMAGRIQSPGALRKSGAGVLGIVGTVANTFTGGFTVVQGDVIAGKTAGLAALPGPVNVGDDTGATPARRLILAADNQITDTATVRVIGDTSVLDLAGFSETFNSLELTGSTAATGAGTLTLTGGGATFPSTTRAFITGRLVLPGTGPRDWNIANGGAEPDLIISASLAAPTGAVFHKLGAGECGFSGTGFDAATVKADAGRVVFLGDQPLLDVILDGAKATGNGTCGNINVQAGGGTITPDLSPRVLHANSLLANSATTLQFELNGIDGGVNYDRLQTRASSSLGNASLDIILGFEPTPGDSFTIIENTNPAATLTGTFAGHPQNTYLSRPGGKVFQINYSGGDGNDVVLTCVAAPIPEFTSFQITPGTGLESGLDVMNITAAGLEGAAYVLETSSNLVDWTARQTVTAGANGAAVFRVVQSAGDAKQFCRLRLL